MVQVLARLVAKCAARRSCFAIMLARMLATVKPVSPKLKTSVVIGMETAPNRILQLATNHLLVRPRPSSLVLAATANRKSNVLPAALTPHHLGLSSSVTMNASA